MGSLANADENIQVPAAAVDHADSEQLVPADGPQSARIRGHSEGTLHRFRGGDSAGLLRRRRRIEDRGADWRLASNGGAGRRYINVPLSSEVTALMAGRVEDRIDFDALFTAHYAALARMICRLVGDIGWAQELAAEAFWKLHRRPPRSRQNLIGWLYRTGLNLALDNLKKQKRRAHYEALASAPGPPH